MRLLGTTVAANNTETLDPILAALTGAGITASAALIVALLGHHFATFRNNYSRRTDRLADLAGDLLEDFLQFRVKFGD